MCFHGLQDGTFGPKHETVKYAVMLNFQRRNFDIQIRVRPLVDCNAKEAESATFESCNFALNYRENKGYRRVELSNGRRINHYAVKVRFLDR